VSKRTDLRFAKSFFLDLDDIFEYIAGNFGERLASNIISDIHDEITEKLSEDPNLGRVYADDDFYRYIFVSKHKDIVFYHIADNRAIVIYRIFDQRRNYARLLDRPIGL
jgi:plasmid stabilization system protein ParE